jgi:hypothetical protein
MTFSEAGPWGEELKTRQHEVQRLLGRCLLRLQQYERLVKAIVAHHQVSVSVSPLKSNQEDRIEDAAGKTLGTLVGSLFEAFFTTDGVAKVAKADASDNNTLFTVKTSLPMSVEDYDRTQKDLKELVLLRNNLVHQFIDQHDLSSLDGCRDGHDFLVSAYGRIDQHFERLRGWAELMGQVQRLASKFAQTDVFENLVINGIAPDGSVDWPVAGIVQALLEASTALAIEGWTPVASAERWIAETYPDQRPAKYGCSSWRQVVHQSHVFELRYRETDGRRAAWYRVRQTNA